MNYSYLNTYDPPMLALKIQLGYPGEKLTLGPLAAIVDTGADGTLIPQSLLDEIEAPLIDNVRVRSPWGKWRYL